MTKLTKIFNRSTFSRTSQRSHRKSARKEPQKELQMWILFEDVRASLHDESSSASCAQSGSKTTAASTNDFTSYQT
jgi:hypothetical protein